MILGFLLSLPVLVKVMGALAFILLLNALIRNLLITVSLGALLLGLWAGHPLRVVGLLAWQRFRSADNLLLTGVFFAIIWLSSLMSETGVMQDLVRVVRARTPPRLSFAALPAVIGLLPMPGGAVFSAPLVDSADRQRVLPALLKSQTNYWFRHVWEYWWPLYPGVILALSLSGLELGRFVLMQLPLTAMAMAGGYLFLLRRIPAREGSASAGGAGAPAAVAATGDGPRGVPPMAAGALPADPPPSGDPPPRRRSEGSFLFLTAPILTVLVVYALLSLLFPGLRRVSSYLPIGMGLLLALGVLQLQRRPPAQLWRKVVLSRNTLYLALLVSAIRIYGAMIESRLPGGTLLVEQMRRELAGLGIPQQLFVMVIPFLTGVAMGINVGTVGASFPVVLSLLGASPATGALMATSFLAYAFGFMGQMLSPVHVCLVVTNQYFKTSLPRSLLPLVAPVALVLAGSYGVSRLLSLLG